MIKPGDSTVYKDQRYVCEALQPYTRRDGTETHLAVIVANCLRCGNPFSSTIPAAGGWSKWLNRHCPRHQTRKAKRLRVRPRIDHGLTAGKPMPAVAPAVVLRK